MSLFVSQLLNGLQFGILLFLLAAGLTSVLGIQAIVILAGTLKIAPLTGITLPFISYGGSSSVTNCPGR